MISQAPILLFILLSAGLAHSSLGISCKGARNASRFPQARFNTFIVNPHATGCATMQESMRVYYEDAHKPVRTAGLAHGSLGISCKGARNASRFPQARFNTFIVNPHATGCATMQESMRVYYEDAHKPVRTAGLAHGSLGISCKGARNASRFPQTRFNTFIVMRKMILKNLEIILNLIYEVLI